MITWVCNRQKGNLELKFMFLIRGEIANSCGQRDSPNNMFVFSGVLPTENGYTTALTSEKKHLLETHVEKYKVSP